MLRYTMAGYDWFNFHETCQDHCQWITLIVAAVQLRTSKGILYLRTFLDNLTSDSSKKHVFGKFPRGFGSAKFFGEKIQSLVMYQLILEQILCMQLLGSNTVSIPIIAHWETCGHCCLNLSGCCLHKQEIFGKNDLSHGESSWFFFFCGNDWTNYFFLEDWTGLDEVCPKMHFLRF